MRTHYLYVLFSIISVICLSSCGPSRYIYNSPKPNVPFLKDKGDSKVAVAASSMGLDFQGAYAFTNNIALTGSASLGVFGNKDENRRSFNRRGSIVRYNQNIFDIGLGYFVSFNPKKTITFNLYGGVGTGKYKLNETGDSSTYSRDYDVNMFEWYLQPSLNFMPGDNFRLGFYFKPTFVKYGAYKSDYQQDELEYFGFDQIHNKTVDYLEFGYDIQVKVPGLSWLSIEHTLSIVPMFSNALENTRLYPEPVSISIGLSADLGHLGLK